MSDQLSTFAEEIIASVNHRCGEFDEIPVDEELQAEIEFTKLMLEAMQDAGVIEDPVDFHLQRSRFRVDAYGFNEEEDKLDLFITMYRDENASPNISREQINSQFRQLRSFFGQTTEDLYKKLKMVQSPAAEQVQLISLELKRFTRVRLFLLTNLIATEKPIDNESDGTYEYEFHVWDLRRLFRSRTTDHNQNKLEIDFLNEFGSCISCIPLFAQDQTSDYKACLAVFPGNVLYGLYKTYGAHLLQRNVRAYLQATGKVNKGIRRTIIEQPDRFFAYNNGISVTADDIEYEPPPRDSGGEWKIRKITNFQIVNGGQTTASIYSAFRKSPENVNKIFVQAKITVVKPELANEIVPKISLYSNSQNKVSEADFFANDAFHVALHAFSTRVWTVSSGKQTKWYYERVRGSYSEEKTLKGVAFERDFPRSQKFEKTELARYWMAWNLMPSVAGLGAQKCFTAFTKKVSEIAPAVDESYFKNTVALIILAKTTIALVKEQKFGGYENHIANYSLGLLASTLQEQRLRLDMDKIWREQKISVHLEKLIRKISTEIVRGQKLAPEGTNLYEWFKKSSTWEQFQKTQFKLESNDFSK